MTTRLMTALLIIASGCTSEVPEDPTYFADVQPILGANCARCHGADPYQGIEKLKAFRLDRYVDDYHPDTQVADSNDAYEYRWNIIKHAVDHESPAMPLDYSLTERQKDVLR